MNQNSEEGSAVPEESSSKLLVEESEMPSVGTKEGQLFGTFQGVFRPTILTILGVMMYLREGWLVGNAGLFGAVLVILACYLITGTTALSISSITTNIRMGSGGVFSIISQSLGLEVGGSVGIPLFLAQGLSAALYMQGIIETWLVLFPSHPQWAVMIGVFAVSIFTSSLSAKLAFQTQIIVMFGAVFALGSMVFGLTKFEISPNPILWGNFEDASFWGLFAVFFPAATGIMVGSSMSGSLVNPRKNIPRGTMAAWFLSLLVYLGLALWYALLGTPETLRDTDQIFAVSHAYWGPAVLIGIMASCFSATLSSLVVAPRVLQALSSHRIIPFHHVFEKKRKGEPLNASIFTGGLVLIVLFLGDLNSIARVLTMFFLVIYFMINLVLLIEHRLKMISFRPHFNIQTWIPITGAISAFTAILIINALTGLIAITFILGIYMYLDRKQLQTPWETVHSGIFAGIANWAAKKVIMTTKPSVKRSWKPDLLIPIERSTQMEGFYRIVRALTYSQGSIQLAAFPSAKNQKERDELDQIVQEFRRDNLYTTLSHVENRDFIRGMQTCVSVLQGSFFKPNTLFTSLESRSEEELQALIQMAKDYRMGVLFLGFHPESRLGLERTVNLWVRDQSPNWQLGLKLANLDYAVLMSYQLACNWNAKIRILTAVKNEEDGEQAREFLTNLIEFARLPNDVTIEVFQGSFFDYLPNAPRADLNIFGLTEQIDKQVLEQRVIDTHSSCLFVLDSGNESALA